MKTISCSVFLSITMSLLSCTSSKQTDFEKINWLVGQWDRINAKEGRTAHELWEKVTEAELQGWGISLQGKDTIFSEKLRIVAKGDTLFYVADVAENAEPIYFKFITLSKTGFTCVNMHHDFPKKIQYILKGDSLKAITSGDGKVFTFEFVRKREQ